MSDGYFRHYIFPEDNDVIFVGLGNWLERDKNVLLGPYLCNACGATIRMGIPRQSG